MTTEDTMLERYNHHLDHNHQTAPQQQVQQAHIIDQQETQQLLGSTLITTDSANESVSASSSELQPSTTNSVDQENTDSAPPTMASQATPDNNVLRSTPDGPFETGNKAATTISGNKIFSESNPPKICFLTSNYAKWVANADRVMDVTKWKEQHFQSEDVASHFEFLVYTNLVNLQTPGWTKILHTVPNTSRFVTQSRWPKFMAWQDKSRIIDTYGCEVIYYMDAIGNVKATPREYQKLALQLVPTEEHPDPGIGFAQYQHRDAFSGIAKEFRRITKYNKDSPENVAKSMEWLQSQEDFRDDAILYENRYFAYHVHSTKFQQISQSFWDHYSLEQDSYRDQPLWCYMLHHYSATPVPLPHKDLFNMDVTRMSRKGHKFHKAMTK